MYVCIIMDGCLELEPIRIPRPQYFTSVDLAIIEQKEKEEEIIAGAQKKYGVKNLEIVKIYKTKPTLGMAVEGGADTPQKMPKVVSIQHGGSAYESGSLKVGHVIVEVNGQSLQDTNHSRAVKIIADAFRDTTKDSVDLLVTTVKKVDDKNT